MLRTPWRQAGVGRQVEGFGRGKLVEKARVVPFDRGEVFRRELEHRGDTVGGGGTGAR